MYLALSSTGLAGCCLHFPSLLCSTCKDKLNSHKSQDSDTVSQRAPRKKQEMGFSCQMPTYKAYGLRDWTVLLLKKKRSTLQALIKLCPSRENLSVWGHSSDSSASLTSKPSFAHLMPISAMQTFIKGLVEGQNKWNAGWEGAVALRKGKVRKRPMKSDPVLVCFHSHGPEI